MLNKPKILKLNHLQTQVFKLFFNKEHLGTLLINTKIKSNMLINDKHDEFKNYLFYITMDIFIHHIAIKKSLSK